jgi:phage terminase large subunit
MLMFNPVSKANWVYGYFFEHGAPPETLVVHTTYRDNVRLPEAYVRSLLELEKRNPAYFRIYVLGEFATLDKLVFPVIEKRLIASEEMAEAYTWVGLDFGYTNDPTAITWGGFVPGVNRLLITGEYHKTGMTNDEIAEAVKSLGLAKEIIIADSAEPKSIEELRRLGLSRIKASVKGPDSVKVGLDRMQRCEIVVDERCVNTVEEFENYTWERDRKTGEYFNRPVDTYNHHIDSIRYGLQAVYNKRPKSEEYRPLWAM